MRQISEWRNYLTVLNVRNFDHTVNAVVTEMVYVHSKLLIVDDAVAILGSANINDRSLKGNGDTELAAVIADDAEAGMTDVGQGIRVVTRKFARELRMQLWKKHLGMLVDQATTGVGKQDAPAGVSIEKPLDAGTIAGIKKLAASNRTTYNEVFLHTPRDSFKTLAEGRQAYKIRYKDRNNKAHEEFSAGAKPDLQPAYMSGPGRHDVAAATARLSAAIKGFWVEMPLAWASEAATPTFPGNAPIMIADRDSLTAEQRG